MLIREPARFADSLPGMLPFERFPLLLNYFDLIFGLLNLLRRVAAGD